MLTGPIHMSSVDNGWSYGPRMDNCWTKLLCHFYRCSAIAVSHYATVKWSLLLMISIKSVSHKWQSLKNLMHFSLLSRWLLLRTFESNWRYEMEPDRTFLINLKATILQNMFNVAWEACKMISLSRASHDWTFYFLSCSLFGSHFSSRCALGIWAIIDFLAINNWDIS